MEKVLIILSLFGCSDAGNQCELLQTADQVYQTRSACERQIDATLQSGQDAPYPTVIAHCGTAAETARVVDDLSPESEPGAAIAAILETAAPSS